MRRLFLLLLGLQLAFFISCSVFNTSTVAIEEHNLEGGVGLTQNLEFNFNKDLAPDSLQQQWDTTQYIRFTPTIPGRFKWVSKRKLIFSPAEELKPSTVYTARLEKPLLKFGDKEWELDKEANITFNTPLLQLESGSVYWSQGPDNGIVQGRLVLTFNYKVRPEEVLQLLEVYQDEQKLELRMVNAAHSRKIEIALADLTGKHGESVELNVKVKPGLACPGSTYKTTEELTSQVFAPARTLLQVTNVAAAHDGNKGEIHVFTTQSLQVEGLTRLIRMFDPQAKDTLPLDIAIEPTSSGCIITGPFNLNQTYELRMDARLTGVLGASLGKEHKQYVVFGQVGKALEFVHQKGTYLSALGTRNVAIQVHNIPRVKVKIAKVYENNIMAFLNSHQRWGYHNDDEMDEWHEYHYYDIDKFGDNIQETEYATTSLPSYGNARLLKMDINDPRQDFRGIYVVEVSSTDEFWRRESKILSISDVGLAVRHGRNSVTVFANSIRTAEALPGTEIALVSSNNQTFMRGVTDDQGIVVFENLAQFQPAFRPAMITARAGQDFNYLLFENSEVETSRFEVGGKYVQEKDYDALIYGERELYRPGETIHLNSLVRTLDWQPVVGMPVTLTVYLPNGKVYRKLRGELNDQGAWPTDVPLPADIVTGKYNLQLSTGADRLIASSAVYVEEFMPDRIKVDLSLNKEKYLLGETVIAKGKATNYFGPPAAERKYETELTIRREAFTPKGYEQYDFSIDDETEFPPINGEGTTDKNGDFEEKIELPAAYQNIGLLQGRMYATVFDETGRPVHRSKRFSLFTQQVFAGIGRFDHYISTQKELRVPLVALRYDEKPVPGTELAVQVVRNRWETVLERENNTYRYVSKRQEQLLYERRVRMDEGGKGLFTFRPQSSGEYEVRVYVGGSKTYVSRYFYSYGWDGNQQAYEVNNDGTIDIALDKESYQVGQTANLVFKTPFEGKLIVTVERQEVIQHHVLFTQNNGAHLALPLNGAHLPNVYISATLIRPLEDDGNPFTVAHGYQRVVVENPANKLPVTIQAQAESRSRRQQRIAINTLPGAEVTIAVVDEGILALRGTRTPDPYGYFYAPRALEVEGYDLYAQLLPELDRGQASLRSTSTGGSDDSFLGRRANPLANKRVKLVSYWSGLKRADAAGNVYYDIDIPQFSGSLRIMAVAYHQGRFGNAEQGMTVADPVVISASIPRFLSPGDTLSMPVTLSNTTKAALQAQATVTLEGPLALVGSATLQAQLPEQNEHRLMYKLVAKNEMGLAKITVKVQAGGETFVDETDLTIRPASTLQQRTGGGILAAGGSQPLNLKETDFYLPSMQAKLIVSRSPLVQWGRDLQYLVQYPYGCVEQTVSAAFPQLYYHEMVKNIAQPGMYTGNPNYNVQQAIQKLQSMQIYNGGLTYWQGGDADDVSWWGSAYGAHFLLEAQKAGYEVDKAMLNQLLNYLNDKVGNGSTAYYTFHDGTRARYYNREVFYSLFVMTMAGRKPLSLMNKFRSETDKMTTDSRYLLAAAYGLLGDRRSMEQLWPKSFGDDQLSRTEFGGSFASPVRDRAIALYVMLETDPGNAQVADMARKLSEQMKKNRYLSTQERSFGFLALGRMAQRANASAGTATVAADGQVLGTLTDGKDLVLTNVAGKNLTLQSTGGGELFYYWELSGISKTGSYDEEDRNLKVRRAYFRKNGDPVLIPRFRQNDLVVVRITLSTEYNDQVDNIAVADLLPAGLEIENPRLVDMSTLPWIKDRNEPEHMDIRDDRIHFFTGVRYGNYKVFYYTARAVSLGRFRQGPVSADAMYDGTYHSYHGATSVEVTPAKGSM